MASINEARDCLSASIDQATPPTSAVGGLQVHEIDNLLSARGSRAWHEGFFAGRTHADDGYRESRREAEALLHERYQKGYEEQAQRLTLEHLSASAPVADAIQKARKAFEAGQSPKNVSERKTARIALGKALTECADAYAKFTAGLSA